MCEPHEIVETNTSKSRLIRVVAVLTDRNAELAKKLEKLEAEKAMAQGPTSACIAEDTVRRIESHMGHDWCKRFADSLA